MEAKERPVSVTNGNDDAIDFLYSGAHRIKYYNCTHEGELLICTLEGLTMCVRIPEWLIYGKHA